MPANSQVDPTQPGPSVIILCHTRELAFQIRNEFNRFSKYMPDVKHNVFYGGVNVKQNHDILKAGIDIVVGIFMFYNF